MSESQHAAANQEKPENLKETIEQILIAFVLAFIFRAFLVEAFVIPTGSMAPTLLGQHMHFRCPDCGQNWKVNYQGFGRGDDEISADNIALAPPAGPGGPARPRTVAVRCDNCGYKLPRSLPDDPLNDAFAPPVRYGDRILVLKYGYLFAQPRRWDVVVFKSPHYDGPVRDRPGEISPPDAYQTNYIKRLVGKPNETVMILDGDIYVSNSDKPLAELQPSDFVVQPKPNRVQGALWRLVYDNDHLPKGLSRSYADPITQIVELQEPEWRQPWTQTQGSGWTTEGRSFRFDGSAAGRLDFDVSASPSTFPMTDWLAYASTKFMTRFANPDNFRPLQHEYPPSRTRLNEVSDLKLQAVYRRTSGEGAMRFGLIKRQTALYAELLPGRYRIMLRNDAGEREIASGEYPSLGSGAGTQVEFSNVDYQLTLRLDGKEVARSSPDSYAPDIAGLIEEFQAGIDSPPGGAFIEASAQEAELSHVSLWRDIYYINQRDPDTGAMPRWASPSGFPIGDGPPAFNSGAQLIRLGPGEYFTLGDNSTMSLDARMWYAPIRLPDEQLFVEPGRVPERFLMGRAFFVYWPSGQPIYGAGFRFIPNFGEMRFIH